MELTGEQLQAIVDIVTRKLLENHRKVDNSSLETQASKSHETVDNQAFDELTYEDKLNANAQNSQSFVYINHAHDCHWTIYNSDHQNSELKNDNQLELSPNDNQLLETLAKEKNTTKIEIIRKALALINIIIQAEEKGNKIAIVDDNEIITEITGF